MCFQSLLLPTVQVDELFVDQFILVKEQFYNLLFYNDMSLFDLFGNHVFKHYRVRLCKDMVDIFATLTINNKLVVLSEEFLTTSTSTKLSFKHIPLKLNLVEVFKKQLRWEKIEDLATAKIHFGRFSSKSKSDDTVLNLMKATNHAYNQCVARNRLLKNEGKTMLQMINILMEIDLSNPACIDRRIRKDINNYIELYKSDPSSIPIGIALALWRHGIRPINFSNSTNSELPNLDETSEEYDENNFICYQVGGDEQLPGKIKRKFIEKAVGSKPKNIAITLPPNGPSRISLPPKEEITSEEREWYNTLPIANQKWDVYPKVERNERNERNKRKERKERKERKHLPHYHANDTKLQVTFPTLDPEAVGIDRTMDYCKVCPRMCNLMDYPFGCTVTTCSFDHHILDKYPMIAYEIGIGNNAMKWQHKVLVKEMTEEFTVEEIERLNSTILHRNKMQYDSFKLEYGEDADDMLKKRCIDYASIIHFPTLEMTMDPRFIAHQEVVLPADVRVCVNTVRENCTTEHLLFAIHTDICPFGNCTDTTCKYIHKGHLCPHFKRCQKEYNTCKDCIATYPPLCPMELYLPFGCQNIHCKCVHSLVHDIPKVVYSDLVSCNPSANTCSFVSDMLSRYRMVNMSMIAEGCDYYLDLEIERISRNQTLQQSFDRLHGSNRTESPFSRNMIYCSDKNIGVKDLCIYYDHIKVTNQWVPAVAKLPHLCTRPTTEGLNDVPCAGFFCTHLHLGQLCKHDVRHHGNYNACKDCQQDMRISRKYRGKM